MDPPSSRVRVLLDIPQTLQQEMLQQLLLAEPQIELIPHTPDDTEFSVATELHNALSETQYRGPAVVITSASYPNPSAAYERWLQQYPELLVIVVNWRSGVIETAQRRIETHRIRPTLSAIYAEIRTLQKSADENSR